jgi:hypothetical protein
MTDFEFADEPLDLADWIMAEAGIGEPLDPEHEITASMLAASSGTETSPGMSVRQAHNILDRLHSEGKLSRRYVRVDGRRCLAYRKSDRLHGMEP